MTRIYFSLLILLVFFSSCRNEQVLEEPIPARGKIISVDDMYSFTKNQVDSIMQGLDPLISVFLQPKYGVKAVKLTYETVDWDDNPTFATGVFLYPDIDSAAQWPVLSYQHGTIMDKAGAPTQNFSGEVIIGVYGASDGYAVCLPDYLGLGDGPGFSPYMHAKSEATATIDLLRAARLHADDIQLMLKDEFYLFGYSQGGHATMAAAKEIETHHASEFTLRAVAPMAGPYDVSGVQAEVIVKDSAYPTPGYLPFILYSYNMVYDVYDDVREVIKDEWDPIIHPRMDGYTGIGQLNNLCPDIPNEILEPAVLEEFRTNPDFILYDILADNDLYDWTPKAPMRLYHCKGDDQVTYKNAIVARNAFHARGATHVKVINTGDDLNHGDCAFPTLIRGKWWFDSLRAN